MLCSEMDLVETDFPANSDEVITDRWFARGRASPQERNRTIIKLVQALAYRFKIQEQFLKVAETFIRLGFLLIEALQCFSLVHECVDYREDVLGNLFEALGRRLATVTVRSCADWMVSLNN